MKKLIILFLALISFTVVSIVILRTPNTVLYLLNWGEYIDQDLVKKFEKEYNCQVVEEDVTSSEIMYQKITSATTAYDVAIPGDYVVRQLYNEGKLKEIKTSNSEFTNLNNYETMFNNDLKSLMNTYMVDNEGNTIDKYYMPYFWGAYSIIYSTRKTDVEQTINDNGFKVFYNRDLFESNDVKIGMYDTARWIVMSYLLNIDENPNITSLVTKSTTGDIDSALTQEIIQELRGANFNEFGNDQLKRNVAIGSLDMCFTQLGDFFDALYLVYDEGINTSDIKFNVCVPENTVAFFDSMVIPYTSKNEDLANKFINFMLDKDNAYQNACNIGYCPTLKSVCDLYNEAADNGEYYFEGDTLESSLTMEDFLNKYPMYLNPLYNTTNPSEIHLLDPKSNEYLTTCETIFNSLAITTTDDEENVSSDYGLLIVIGIALIVGIPIYLIIKKKKHK